MGIRRDVARNQADRDAYIRGCVELCNRMTGITARQMNTFLAPRVPNWQMRGDPDIELSSWDLFSLWHYVTMQLQTPGQGSNRAHGGPIFLPWHRLFLIRLEEVLQIVLRDPNFGLPYWDWARDRQLNNPLWRANQLGTNRGTVTNGAIGQLRVRLSGRWGAGIGSFLEAHAPRPITRNAGRALNGSRLPRKTHVAACLQENVYDAPPWDTNAVDFRNHLEGWRPYGLHNLVHVWVGGDMGPATSPNDPVFYLNHCNVDRIWQAKLDGPGGLPYLPAGGGPPGHNINDPMIALIGASMTPAEVLNPAPFYDYDNLDVDV